MWELPEPKKPYISLPLSPIICKKVGPLPSRFFGRSRHRNMQTTPGKFTPAKRWPDLKMVKWKQAVLQVQSRSFLANLESYLDNLALLELKNYVNRIREDLKEETPFKYKYSYESLQKENRGYPGGRIWSQPLG